MRGAFIRRFRLIYVKNDPKPQMFLRRLKTSLALDAYLCINYRFGKELHFL